MDKTKNKLYLVLFTACVFGYIWLIYNLLHTTNQTSSLSVCYLKNITGYPCPSCGTTRSILSILKGAFIEGLTINPMGILVLALMLILPVWIFIDLITKNDSLFCSYKKMEIVLKQPKFYIPLIFLVLLNWIWNIYKDL